MVQLVASGLAMGCVYALIAVGFNLLFGVARILNFAQGELVMVGALVGVALVSGWSLDGASVLVLVSIVSAVIGLAYYRLVYFPLRRVPTEMFLIASVGVGIALRNGAHILWGPEPRGMPSFFGTEFITLAGARLTPQHVFVGAVTALLIGAQYVLFRKTRLGRRLRAIAQDTEIARLMGVRVDRLIPCVFAISAALSGIAGVLVAPIFLASPEMGVPLLLKSFIAIVIGGFGSILGAIVGGLGLGVLETMVAAWISSAYKDVIAYLVLIAFLLVRPTGFFGEEVAEKV